MEIIQKKQRRPLKSEMYHFRLKYILDGGNYCPGITDQLGSWLCSPQPQHCMKFQKIYWRVPSIGGCMERRWHPPPPPNPTPASRFFHFYPLIFQKVTASDPLAHPPHPPYGVAAPLRENLDTPLPSVKLVQSVGGKCINNLKHRVTIPCKWSFVELLMKSGAFHWKALCFSLKSIALFMKNTWKATKTTDSTQISHFDLVFHRVQREGQLGRSYILMVFGGAHVCLVVHVCVHGACMPNDFMKSNWILQSNKIS